ncbi:MAG: lysozyme inhibitor LprI family protein [Burkholderiales bacterium]
MRIAATLVLLLLLLSGRASAAIDCSRASSNADLLVCSNDQLALADERMALAFRDAMRRGVDRNKLITTQRDWTANVRDRCNDFACLMHAYDDRAAELDNY